MIKLSSLFKFLKLFHGKVLWNLVFGIVLTEQLTEEYARTDDTFRSRFDYGQSLSSGIVD